MDNTLDFLEELDHASAENPQTWVVSEQSDMGVSDSQLVPDEIVGELIRIRDQVTSSCFRIGDIANDMVMRAAQIGFDRIPAWRVHRAVGRFAGKSQRTVRYYAEVAAFYPAKVRTEFEVLPFSHFVFAKTMGALWRDVMEYAGEHPDATVEGLRYEFIEKPAEPEVRVGTGIVRSVGEAPDLIIEADKTCEVSQDKAGRDTPPLPGCGIVAINACGDVLSALTRLDGALEDVELSPTILDHFFDLSSEFRRLISDIVQKLAK